VGAIPKFFVRKPLSSKPSPVLGGMEKEFEMFTQKGNSFHELQDQVNDLVAGNGCMVCGNGTQEVVDKVAEILKGYGIDPKDVEAEMLTITDNFAFAEGWKIPGSKSCYVYHRDFFAVCYKLMK